MFSVRSMFLIRITCLRIQIRVFTSVRIRPFKTVLWIWIQIRMSLGLPDPSIICMDPDEDLDPYPDPSINKQKERKNWISTILWLLFDLFSVKTDENVPSKRNKEKTYFLLAPSQPLTKRTGSGSIIQWYGSAVLNPYVPKYHGSTTLLKNTVHRWYLEDRTRFHSFHERIQTRHNDIWIWILEVLNRNMAKCTKTILISGRFFDLGILHREFQPFRVSDDQNCIYRST